MNKVKKPPESSLFVMKPADIDFTQKGDFTLVETEENVKQSLNNQDAIQVIYNDLSLQSIYAKAQDKPILPSDQKVFEIIPRLND